MEFSLTSVEVDVQYVYFNNKSEDNRQQNNKGASTRQDKY